MQDFASSGDLLILFSFFDALIEAYNFLFPFYMEKLAPCVEEDLLKLRVRRNRKGIDGRNHKNGVFPLFLLLFFSMQVMYEGPEYLVEKMKSLSLSQDCSLGGEVRFRVEAPRLNTDGSAGRRGKHQSFGSVLRHKPDPEL